MTRLAVAEWTHERQEHDGTRASRGPAAHHQAAAAHATPRSEQRAHHHARRSGGYGKTTLAREWLAEGGRRAAWYQADASSRDIAAFAAGVAGAVSTILPSAGEGMAGHLRASPAPESDAHVLARTLANDLTSWPAGAWLVIDDYHRAGLSEASDLFADVLASSDTCRILFLSRKRPRWATARRRLYGEVLEIDRTLLTMTDEEAGAILPSRNPRETSRLVEGSKGWPAIIGLAALTSAKRAAGPLPLSKDLYDYFAEELYRAAHPWLRRGLTVLSLAPHLTVDLAARLLGDEHASVIKQGLDAGFLTSGSAGDIEMHPLIRRFLRERFKENGGPDTGIVRGVATVLIEFEQWDDAFDLVAELQAFDLLDHLVVHSLTGSWTRIGYPRLLHG